MDLTVTETELKRAELELEANALQAQLYGKPIYAVDTPAHWKAEALQAIDHAIATAEVEVNDPLLGRSLEIAAADGRITTTLIAQKIRRAQG